MPLKAHCPLKSSEHPKRFCLRCELQPTEKWPQKTPQQIATVIPSESPIPLGGEDESRDPEDATNTILSLVLFHEGESMGVQTVLSRGPQNRAGVARFGVGRGDIEDAERFIHARDCKAYALRFFRPSAGLDGGFSRFSSEHVSSQSKIHQPLITLALDLKKIDNI
jgi:hypothetical protein